MSIRNVAALYDSYEDALRTIRDLDAANYPHDQIGLVANNAENHWYVPAGHAKHIGVGALETGASIGTAIGGGAGLLAGLGILSLPGIGPVVAVGWLVPMLIGAAAGAGLGAVPGLIGAMTDSGIPAEHALRYVEAVRRGGTIVVARSDVAHLATIEAIMRRHNPAEIDDRSAAYRAQPDTSSDAGTTQHPREL